MMRLTRKLSNKTSLLPLSLAALTCALIAPAMPPHGSPPSRLRS